LVYFSLLLRGLAVLLVAAVPGLAHAATLNVPSAAYPTIQSGVNVATDGDTVLVADGTYTGPGNRDIDFNGKNITVTSQNGPNKTIIDCGGFASTDGSGNHRGFYIHSGETAATISGFTVKNGYENSSIVTTASDYSGGGICIVNSNAAIQNCTIIENIAQFGGGIFSVIDGNNTITLTNCAITGNTASESGGGCSDSISGGTITLNNCIISKNTANGFGGGGVFNDYTSNVGGGIISLINCTVTSNTTLNGGGGICNYNSLNGGTIMLTDCLVSANTAINDGGGVSNFSGTMTLTNCSITNNTAQNGGGIANVEYTDTGSKGNGTITVINCTVSGNTASNQANGIYNYNYNGTITLTNDIIYKDTGNEVANDANATTSAVISFCDIQGGYPGTGNIDKDPLFVNAAYGDLHLKSGSPCIGRGTATGAPATDKDGNLRHNPPSIGAYEGAGNGGVVLRPTGSLTLYDAGYDASHVDFSDNAVGPVDVARLTSDTQVCTGAAADGATKILLRYTASASGTVAFTDAGSVSGDSLRAISATTQLINGQYVAFALYTVPESLDGTPEGLANPGHFVQHSVSLQAVFTPTGGAALPAVALPLTLESPPIVLIHGLWSSANDTWNKAGGVRDALVAAGYVANPNAPNRSLFLVDYSATNTASLDVNQAVLLLNTGGINTAHQAYQGRGVAMTRVDVVGHSMGGLITRKFATWSVYATKHNYGKGYVRRMVTIGSPHLGSPLGSYLNTLHSLPLLGPTVDVLLFKLGKGYGPAIEDLEPGSSGLVSLGATNIPCFAEVGNYDVQHLGDLTNLYNLLLFFGCNLHLGESPSLSQLDSALFLGQSNDAVVPVPSQEDGLPSQFYNVTGFTNHLQEAGSGTIGADVVRLLTGPLTDFDAGFSPAAKSAITPPRTASLRDSAVTAPFVTISAPAAGQVFSVGDTLTVTVVPNAGVTLTQTLIQAGASPRDAGTALVSQAPYTAAFSLPSASIGTFPVTVTAKDSAGDVCNVTVNVFVQTNATLTSMAVSAGTSAPNSAALLTSQGSTNPLTVIGTFSDATQSDITAAALGTTYASSDPTVATVDTNGVLTAVANGNCTITVTNGSITATENVIVQLGTPNILSTTPASAAPGTTVSLTLTGTDFGGASQLQFLLNGAPDPNITVTSLSVGSQGTSLTASVTATAGAVPGLRTITVSTPGGTSDVLAASDAAGFTVIPPPGKVHVFWNNTNGSLSLWNYDPSSGGFTQKTYGPYPGWTAKAVADGTDGMTRVLWDNADGRMSLWSLDNTSGSFTQHTFGPYPNWTARFVSVASNGTTHVLWTNTSGAASVWNYSTTAGTFTETTYGPYPNWTAAAMADGADGQTRLMWTNTDGRMSLWSLNNTTGAFSQFTFGPYPGWTAKAVSVNGSNTTHILWDNTNGQASLWNYNAANGTFTQNNYGAYPGWTANALADGPDGKTQVLWNKTDGTLSLWDLDNTTSVFTQNSYGPYPGWAAAGVSAP
jgi:pimeloyl-ACP methyl ester carboxylesterase